MISQEVRAYAETLSSKKHRERQGEFDKELRRLQDFSPRLC